MLLNACSLRTEPDDTSPLPSEGVPTAAPIVADNQPSSSEPVGITFGAQESDRKTFEPLIETFNSANPDVRVQFVSLDDAYESADAELDPSADIHNIVTAADTAITYGITTDAVRKGYLGDLKPLMDTDASFDRDDFYPAALAGATRSDGIYILPRTMYVPLLTYNETAWLARGVPLPTPDWTWNDLFAAAQQLARVRGNTVEFYGLADLNGVTPLFAELERTDTRIIDATGQVRIDQPAVADAISRVAALSQSGAFYLFAPGGQIFSGGQADTLILEQKVGMWSPFMAVDVIDRTKQLFTTKTVPLPLVDDGSLYSVSGYIMSSGTQNTQAAWRWLAYLSSQPVQLKYEPTDSAGVLPARQSVAKQLGYWENRAADGSKEAVEAVLNRPLRVERSANILQSYMVLNQALAAVITNGVTGETAVREAQAAYDQETMQVQQTATAAGPPPSIVVATPRPQLTTAAVTTVRVAASGLDTTAVRAFVDQFNEQSPEMQMEVVELAETSSSIGRTLFQTMANTADIVLWTGSPPDAADVTLDLQPFIDADFSFAVPDYPSSLLARLKRSTKLIGLPIGMNLRVLAYNPDAFAQSGVAVPDAQWTLNSFIDVAQQLTSNADPRRQVGFAGGGVDTLTFFLNRLNAPLTTGEGEALALNYTDTQVVQAIQVYLDFARTATSAQQLTGYRRSASGDDTAQRVAAGDVGMWFDYGTRSSFSLPDGATRGITPPLLQAGQVSDTDLTMLSGYISATTSHGQQAWSVLKAISVDEALVAGLFPARTSLVQSAAFTEAAPQGAGAVYEAYLRALEEVPSTSGAATIVPDTSVNLYWFYRAVDRALQNKQVLVSELQQAQVVTEQYLDCVRAGNEAAVCAIQVDPSYEGLE